ncbi:response regulator [Paenibacillus nasutitermitis]|uniref:DNA-binding response regulator n=1 Tax=Paenibacillus nasutitermitis TaxID=1652958 RepID=A0A916YLL2_9BACL|nr:response regulator [Paenibacillus nasutitermitis]GGD51262.1 hypothetical protein GCM10010911_06020 [Paenibacillus nasutitermitis]
MYQVMLVDDHTHLVDSMAKTIPWETLGIGHVHKAYSAYEALELMQSHPIDLVITDIRMPGMSGLELIENIRRSWKKAKCILLSGYSDFEYAKEALLQEVDDYLLKPINNDELIHSIQRILEKAREEWLEIVSNQRALQTLQQNLPILKQNLLNDLLLGHKQSIKQLQEQLETFAIPINMEQPVALAMIRLEDDYPDYNAGYLFEYSITNIAEEISEHDFRLWSCRDTYGYLVFLIIPEDERIKVTAEEPFGELQVLLEQFAAQLQHYVKNVLKGRISILVSEWFPFPGELHGCYQNCLFAFRQRIGDEREFFMTLSDSVPDQNIAIFSSLYEPPTLKQIIETGHKKELYDKLNRIFDELLKDWSHSEEHILEAYLEICGMLTYIVHKNRKRLSELIGDEYEKLTGGLPFKTVKQLRDWTFRILERLSNLVDQERRHSHAAIIRQVHDFIGKNLSKDVSIQTIANHVYLHPSYLSRVYKSESGESLSDYVLRVRMEKAVTLLRSKPLKIYDIASELGYNQTQHFIKMFKKQFGHTPQEYRERLHES